MVKIKAKMQEQRQKLHKQEMKMCNQITQSRRYLSISGRNELEF